MKKGFLLIAFTLLTFISLGQVDNGLIAKYSFNQGDANDEAGNHDGIIHGVTSTTDRFGNSNSAFLFKTSELDYIEVPYSPDFTPGTDPRSVSVWFQSFGVPPEHQQVIITWSRCGASNPCQDDDAANYYVFIDSSDRLAFNVRDDAKHESQVSTAQPCNDGIWHHAVLVFNPIGDSIRYYFDDILFDSVIIPPGTFTDGGVQIPLEIGRHIRAYYGSSAFYFNGKIDDIRIYDRALTTLEVDSLFNELDPFLQAEVPPVIQWQAGFGGNMDNVGSEVRVRQTSDGGYIVGASSNSDSSGNKSDPSRGEHDYWIIKTDENGIKEWDAVLGGNKNDILHDLCQTPDGGYLLGGNSNSDKSGDKTQINKGGGDYWVVKTDSNGIKEWDRTYGGSASDALIAIAKTSDGGFILGGSSFSDMGGDKTHSNCASGTPDFWIVKINSNGTKQWDSTFGGFSAGGGAEYLGALQATSDGGFIMGGSTTSKASCNKSSSCIPSPIYDLETCGTDSCCSGDYWVVKINSNGVKEWDSTFGGTKSEMKGIVDLTETIDGGLVFGGSSDSPIGRDKSQENIGGSDFWILKTDANGTKQWDSAYGGFDGDVFQSLIQDPDGSYLFGGFTNSPQGHDISSDNRGIGTDYWLIKTNVNGVKQWDLRFGGTDRDDLNDIIRTSDGGYLLAGSSQSGCNGDKTVLNKGETDIWLIKLTPSCTSQFFHVDADGDGYGNPNVKILACYAPCGYVNDSTDCNDENPSLHFGATEICNGIDDNCNGLIDGADPSLDLSTLSIWYADDDNDGYGSSLFSDIVFACNQPEGCVSSNGDCNDANPNINPGAIEFCNGIDDNCDGIADALIVATINPSGTISECKNVPVTLNALPTETNFTYQWKRNNNSTTGATNASFTTTQNGSFTVMITDNTTTCSSESVLTVIKRKPAPKATINTSNLDLCPTDSVTLVANSGNGLSYQWFLNNHSIGGATNQMYTTTMPGIYKVLVTNLSSCTKKSGPVTVFSSCKEGSQHSNTNDETELTVYPNPSHSEFTIDLRSNENVSSVIIEVLNIVGENIYTEQAQIVNGILSRVINLGSNNASGMYYVRIIADDVVITKKIEIVK